LNTGVDRGRCCTGGAACSGEHSLPPCSSLPTHAGYPEVAGGHSRGRSHSYCDDTGHLRDAWPIVPHCNPDLRVAQEIPFVRSSTDGVSVRSMHARTTRRVRPRHAPEADTSTRWKKSKPATASDEPRRRRRRRPSQRSTRAATKRHACSSGVGQRLPFQSTLPSLASCSLVVENTTTDELPSASSLAPPLSPPTLPLSTSRARHEDRNGC
jgi:hypothetical protein